MSQRQKHYRCKNFFVSECAVSTALGFVIITGILVSAFCIFVAVQVPQMTKVTEAEHAAELPLEFAAIDSVIDMAILQGGSSDLECRVDMLPDSVPVVGGYTSAGTLEFWNSTEKFRFKACAPFEVAPDDNDTHWWNSTPANFSGSEYTRFQVVTPPDRGAELALEIGEDRIFESGGEVYLAGEFWYNNFVVKNSTTLYTSDLVIHAMKIVIEQGSAINADGLGYSGGARNYRGEGDGNGSSPMNMTGCREGNCSCGGGGGSYGGKGGDGGGSNVSGHYCDWGDHHYDDDVAAEGGKGGSTYGHASMQEYHPGSGGGGGSSGRNLKYYYYSAASGGAGGGYVVLDAPVISIKGDVSADGGEGHIVLNSAHTSPGGGGGGGSGGCILLKGDDVTINGSLSAKGGDGGDGRRGTRQRKNPSYIDDFYGNGASGGGGGGGGRIKVFSDSNFSSPGGLNTHTNVDGGAKGLGNLTCTECCSTGTACTSAQMNDNPKEGYDGTAGASGTITNDSITYTPKVYYHALGCLDSEAYNNTVTPLVCYGNMTWNATVDADTSIIMKVRSSIDKDMAYALSWDDCSPVVKGTDISDLPSVSDGHKYIQWRAKFITYDLSKTPVLDSVNISYEYGVPFIVNTSGCIRYSRYVNYRSELVYSQGATLKKQPEGGLMLSAPPFSISKKQGDLNYTKLIITAINLTGSDNSLSSGFQASIKPYNTNSELITGGLYFINLTINITTEYPDVWENWFDATSKNAGLVHGDNPGNYNITKAGNQVQIVFLGNETMPVRIWLKRAEAGIELRVDG